MANRAEPTLEHELVFIAAGGYGHEDEPYSTMLETPQRFKVGRLRCDKTSTDGKWLYSVEVADRVSGKREVVKIPAKWAEDSRYIDLALAASEQEVAQQIA